MTNAMALVLLALYVSAESNVTTPATTSTTTEAAVQLPAANSTAAPANYSTTTSAPSFGSRFGLIDLVQYERNRPASTSVVVFPSSLLNPQYSRHASNTGSSSVPSDWGVNDAPSIYASYPNDASYLRPVGSLGRSSTGGGNPDWEADSVPYGNWVPKGNTNNWVGSPIQPNNPLRTGVRWDEALANSPRNPTFIPTYSTANISPNLYNPAQDPTNIRNNPGLSSSSFDQNNWSGLPRTNFQTSPEGEGIGSANVYPNQFNPNQNTWGESSADAVSPNLWSSSAGNPNLSDNNPNKIIVGGRIVTPGFGNNPNVGSGNVFPSSGWSSNGVNNPSTFPTNNYWPGSGSANNYPIQSSNAYPNQLGSSLLTQRPISSNNWSGSGNLPSQYWNDNTAVNFPSNAWSGSRTSGNSYPNQEAGTWLGNTNVASNNLPGNWNYPVSRSPGSGFSQGQLAADSAYFPEARNAKPERQASVTLLPVLTVV